MLLNVQTSKTCFVGNNFWYLIILSVFVGENVIVMAICLQTAYSSIKQYNDLI